jgi:DNA repair protein RecO (recombination protein O)
MGVGSSSAGPPLGTEAVVLRLVDYAEADRIVTLYTRDHGKVSALARSARRSRGRFGGALSPFVAGEAILRPRRGSELFVLERFDARHDFSSLAGDVVRFAHASYATELCRELTPAGQADPTLYELLVELYDVVTRCEPRADVLRAFELRLLEEIGLRPVFDRCVVCNALDAETLAAAGAILSPERGGLVCAGCAGRGAGAFGGGNGVRSLPAAARARLLVVQRASLAEAADAAPASPELATAAREAMHALLRTHLRQPLKSLEFLQKLRG